MNKSFSPTLINSTALCALRISPLLASEARFRLRIPPLFLTSRRLISSRNPLAGLCYTLRQPRNLGARYSTMATMEKDLAAPNGVKWPQPLGLFINNDFVPSSNGQMLATINPATEEKICDVHAATAVDVDKAVNAAHDAFKSPKWRNLTGTERGRLLSRLADLVEQQSHLLATIETLDNGKPFSVTRDLDVPHFVAVLRYYGGFADKYFGQTIDLGRNKMAYTLKEPVGVCGQIIPWNYPLDMAAWKLGPALACGNTLVLKLAEQTPLSMLYVAKLVAEAGIPPGVVNIINGYGKEAGAALVDNPKVHKIAFTGSTATGKEIMKAAARTMKNITLETGGKSPFIVFEDANIPQAVKWAHSGIMSNSGQICTANSRILVHESVSTAFVEQFKEKVAKTSILGDPFDEKTFQGPQVSKEQYDRVLAYIQSGLDDGAQLIMGGKPAEGATAGGKGYFIEPTVFGNVLLDSKICQEEIFGPCALIIPFKTEAQAIEIANDSKYGLGAMVFTRDLVRAHRVARDVESGMVWINSSNDSDVRVPFGGVKQSGIGRELGEAGLEPYFNVKAIHVNLTED